jgi:hypothetical protein
LYLIYLFQLRYDNVLIALLDILKKSYFINSINSFLGSLLVSSTIIAYGGIWALLVRGMIATQYVSHYFLELFIFKLRLRMRFSICREFTNFVLEFMHKSKGNLKDGVWQS